MGPTDPGRAHSRVRLIAPRLRTVSPAHRREIVTAGEERYHRNTMLRFSTTRIVMGAFHRGGPEGGESMDSPEKDEELGVDGVSRRTMLKRIGAGAAVAWTAPILTSIRSPAFAQSVCDCPECACSDASPVCGSDANGDCFCAPEQGTGECTCISNAFGSGGACGGPTCPPGEACIRHCSDGCAQPYCLLLCGASSASPQRARPLRSR